MTFINPNVDIDPHIIEMMKRSGRAHEGGRETHFEAAEKAKAHMERMNKLAHEARAKANIAQAKADEARAKWKRIQATPDAHAGKPRKGKKADGGEPRVPRLPQPVRTPRAAPVPRSDEEKAASGLKYLEKQTQYLNGLVAKAADLMQTLTAENKDDIKGRVGQYAEKARKVLADLAARGIPYASLARARVTSETLDALVADPRLNARAAFRAIPGLSARGESHTLSGTRFGRA
jgi:hypothetical protein